MKLNVGFIPLEGIKSIASDFLDEFYPKKDIPIPIDLIIESKFDIEIIPTPFIRNDVGSDSCFSSDFKIIYIDQDIYLKNEARLRFSLAHEIGHLFIHRKIFDGLKFSTIEEWKKIYLSINDKEYGWLEFQAHTFAAFVLIPDYDFKIRFETILTDILPDIEEVKNKGIDRKQYLDYIISNIARKAARFYNVSVDAMERRIKNDPLYCEAIP